MRVLLDNNVNWKFGRLLLGHEVSHVQDLGWANLRNGDLLSAAENSRFDVLITADKQMQYQQSLAGRTLSVVVLGSLFITYRHIAQLADQVLEVLDSMGPGSLVVVRPRQ